MSHVGVILSKARLCTVLMARGCRPQSSASRHGSLLPGLPQLLVLQPLTCLSGHHRLAGAPTMLLLLSVLPFPLQVLCSTFGLLITGRVLVVAHCFV